MKLPKQANLWFPSYLRDRVRRGIFRKRAKRLWVALTDHYEPMGGGVSLTRGLQRVAEWEHRWPEIAAGAPRDHNGRQPCFTFFYPQEEYEPRILEKLAKLSGAGIADVEVHLHHFDDNAENLKQKLAIFKRQLNEEHGLLHHHRGKLVFGFIHGNWALDNSHPTGFGCGVKGELQVLRDSGCYADFTMPSLPSPTQSRVVNQIYWTTGDPAMPRGFDKGVEAKPGGGVQGDMLMITGPTGFRFRDRLLPRLETGEIASYDLPTPYRVKRWLDFASQIGEDVFLKLYGHSAREDNAAALLGSGDSPGSLAPMFEWIAHEARRRSLELHWASAFEMFQAIDKLVRPSGPLIDSLDPSSARK